MPGLLTHLARTVGSSQIENVASAALRYLLVTHPAAGSAMTAYLRELTGGDLPDLGYASQSGEPGAGIVDITATDHNGTEHVVVEAKVEAGFQPDQIATYLTRVEPVGGYVVVLAPQRRLAHLRAHALAQAATAGPDGQDRTARVALTTWEQVLSVLQSAVGGDPDARFELDQITELYRDLERLQRIPLDSRHVSDETARTVATMFAVVDELLDAVNARRDPDVRLDRNRRGGTWGAGARGAIHGVDAWAGMWLPPWVETGGTPYWLTLSVGPGNAHRVATALASAYPDLPGPHVRDQQPGTVVAPLYCPPGAEPDRLVDALAGQVFRLAVHVADL